jgi:hypothetical protein
MLKNNVSAIVLSVMALTLPSIAHAQAPLVTPQRPFPPASAPVAPIKATEPRGDNPPIGVPLPSLLQGNNAASIKPGAGIPDSTQTFGLDNKRVDSVLDRMVKQADDRVSKINTEPQSGSMTPPDVTPYRSDLQQMSDIQRQLRLMDLKQKQAEAAMKYWSTVYDPRKEEDVAKGASVKDEKPDAVKSSTPVGPLGPVGTNANPAPPPMPAEALKTDLPLPKVVSIMGGSSLKAVLLVPYIGEMQAHVGTTLPGDRRVVKISSEGVNVEDPKLGVITLGYGDSVPLSPNASPLSGQGGQGVGGINGMPPGLGFNNTSPNTLMNIPRITPMAPPVVTPSSPVLPVLPQLPKRP